MRIKRSAGSTSGVVAAPANAPFITWGLNADLTGEFSIRSSDVSTLVGSFEATFKWAEAAERFVRVENLTAGGSVSFQVVGPDANAPGHFLIRRSSDTIHRMLLSESALLFGPGGASALDCQLSRSGALEFLFAAGNLVRFGGGVRLDASQTLRFRNPANTFQSTLVGGAQTADIAYTLPIAPPFSAGMSISVLTSNLSGTMQWGTAAGSFGLSDDAFIITMAVAH